MRMLFLLLSCLLVAPAAAQTDLSHDDLRDALEDREKKELVQGTWDFYEPNYKNGFKSPTCPDSSIDIELQDAFKSVEAAGAELEKVRTDTSPEAEAAANALNKAIGVYEDVVAVCRYTLRKANRDVDLRIFQDQIRPYM